MNLTVVTPPPARPSIGRPVSTPNFSGIYGIMCIPTGRLYVGSAVNIAKRWCYHREDLRKSKHHNSMLQHAWEKYGEAAFEFAVLERCAKDELLSTEQKCIDGLGVTDRRLGFNLNPIAGSCLGKRHSDETRKRMSEIAKARPKRILTQEQREQMAARMRGNTCSLGYKHTDETRAKLVISAARPRRKHKKTVSPEGLRKRAERRGIALNEEHRARIGRALKGKAKSPEHRRLLGEVQRRYDDSQVATMRGMSASGTSYAKIGALFGCCSQTVCNIVLRRGVYA